MSNNIIYYRKKRILELFGKYTDHRIAVYGTGVNAKRIIEYASDRIFAVVDDNKNGFLFHGKKVISTDKAILSGVRIIIIAAKFRSELEILNRIEFICSANDILVFDQYGNNLLELSRIILEQDITYCNRTQEEYIKALNNYDTVYFQLDKTIPFEYIEDIVSITEYYGKNIHFIIYDEELSLARSIKERAIIIKTSNDLEAIFLNFIHDDSSRKLYVSGNLDGIIFCALSFGFDLFLIKSRLQLLKESQYGFDWSLSNASDMEIIYNFSRVLFKNPFYDGTFIIPKLTDSRAYFLLQKKQELEKNSVVVSNNKKKILVFDASVPKYDKGAGYRLTFHYLQLFNEMGLQVFFIPYDGIEDEKYCNELKKQGINVLAGNAFDDCYIQWLAIYGQFFDYVYIQRPQVAEKYYKLAKEYCSNAKIFYFDHDLHFNRLRREFEIKGDKEILIEADKMEKLEISIMSSVDVIHVVGTYEYEIVKERIPFATVRNIPLFIYDEIKEDKMDFASRKDLMFVGGFGHSPNIDGLIWFIENVFSNVIKTYSNIILHIVGANPPDELRRLSDESDSIILHGFVTDEELIKMYRNVRISVAPLRYGAGIKGKIVEAAYHQIPVVTTSIGAEGLPMKYGNICVVDDASAMTNKIIELYTNIERLSNMSAMCVPFINDNFSKKRAIEVLENDISGAGK